MFKKFEAIYNYSITRNPFFQNHENNLNNKTCLEILNKYYDDIEEDINHCLLCMIQIHQSYSQSSSKKSSNNPPFSQIQKGKFHSTMVIKNP